MSGGNPHGKHHNIGIIQISTGTLLGVSVEKSVESVHKYLYIRGIERGRHRIPVENRGKFTTFSDFFPAVDGFR